MAIDYIHAFKYALEIEDIELAKQVLTTHINKCSVSKRIVNTLINCKNVDLIRFGIEILDLEDIMYSRYVFSNIIRLNNVETLSFILNKYKYDNILKICHKYSTLTTDDAIKQDHITEAFRTMNREIIDIILSVTNVKPKNETLNYIMQYCNDEKLLHLLLEYGLTFTASNVLPQKYSYSISIKIIDLVIKTNSVFFDPIIDDVLQGSYYKMLKYLIDNYKQYINSSHFKKAFDIAISDVILHNGLHDEHVRIINLLVRANIPSYPE